MLNHLTVPILAFTDPLHIFWRHGPFPMMQFIVAAFLAILGISVAAQAVARSQRRRMSWEQAARSYAGVSWIVPVVAVVGMYIWWAGPRLSGDPGRRRVSATTAVRRMMPRHGDWIVRVNPQESGDYSCTVPSDSSTHVVPAVAAEKQALASEPETLLASAPPQQASPPTPSAAAPTVPKAALPQAAANGTSVAAPAANPPATSPAAVAAPTQKAPAATSSQSGADAAKANTDTETAAAPEPQLPDWVGKNVVESENSRFVVVRSEISATTDEAKQKALDAATALVTEGFASYYPEAHGWQPPPSLVQSEAVRKEYIEPIDRTLSTSGTRFRVYRAYYQVELSPNVWSLLIPSWRDEVVDRRLWALGGLAGLLTLTFGTLAAYFRLDERTAGRYRLRLKLAAFSVIAAGGVAAASLL